MTQAIRHDERYGRYLLLERLGAGAATEVFRAKSFGVEGFEKTLVVKRLLPELLTDAPFVHRFIERARFSVRLSHANIVQVFDLGSVETPYGSSFFMATEFVPGRDLGTLVHRSRMAGEFLPVDCSIYVGAELAKALDHAHRKRDEQLRPLAICHGGLGARDVLVSWEGEVKLTDFGVTGPQLGRAVPNHELPMGGVESSYYGLSPEQSVGHPPSPSADVFSLGAILYECLTGQSPFEGQSPAEFVARLQAGSYVPLDQLRGDVPPALAALVHQCLALDPAQRPASAGQLYEDLVAHQYALGARFGAVELSELLSRYAGDVAAQPPSDFGAAFEPGASVPPVEVEDVALDDVAIVSTSIPPLVNYGESRESTVLVLRLKSGGVSEALLARARDTLTRYGAVLLDSAAADVAAVFGVRDADGRDTETAVRCGMVLQRILTAGEAVPAVGVVFGRIKLEGGSVLAADASTNALVERARALTDAAPRRVSVTQTAAKHLRGLFVLQDLSTPPAGLVGYVVGAGRPAHSTDGKFFGRRQELKEIGEVFAHAARRHLAMVRIAGAQGLGKTRLLMEMNRRLQRGSLDVGCYLATCPVGGSDDAYSGVRAMLRKLCGLSEGDPDERVLAVEPRLRALGLTEDELGALFAELGVLRASPSIPELVPAAVERMFSRLAEDRLHVLAWDNAHELDRASAELMVGLAGKLAGSRLVLAFAGRPVEGVAFAELGAHHHLTLTELDAEETRKLVLDRLGVQSIPEPLVEFVRARAGGHPMFVEELLREAVDSGAVKLSGGTVDSLDLGGAVAVPRSLRALLIDRVRRLPDEERDVLVAAALLGTPADTAVIADMLELPIGSVSAATDSLEALQLVRRDGPVALAFDSPMLPEVAVAELAPDALVDLHVRAARAYQNARGNTGATAGSIAHHLLAAGESDGAAGFLALSGQYHLELRQLSRAARDFAEALRHADLDVRQSEEIADWLVHFARALRQVRVGADLPDLARRLTAHFARDQRIDQRLRVRVGIYVAMVLGALHHYKHAAELLAQSVSRAKPWPDIERDALIAQADIAQNQGEYPVAIAALERIADLGQASDDMRHRVLVLRARALAATNQHSKALAAIEQAELIRSTHDPAHTCEREQARAYLLAVHADWAGSARAAEAAGAAAREAGLPHEVGASLAAQGVALIHLSDFPRSHAAFRGVLDVAAGLGAQRLGNTARMYLAFLDALQGSPDGLGGVGQCLATADEHHWVADVVEGRLLLARLLAKSGERAGAGRELEIAERLATENKNRVALNDCAELRAKLSA